MDQHGSATTEPGALPGHHCRTCRLRMLARQTTETAYLVNKLDEALQQALQAMMRQPPASACEAIDGCDGLLDEEAALVARAVEGRRREFSAGRRCARRALAALGCPPLPLLIGQWREPIWPPGFAGSISHDGRFAVALAYPSASGRAWLSIDLIDRPDRQIFCDIAGTISHPADTPVSRDDPLAIARLFSAKEAAIKIVSPRAGAFVDFRDLRARLTEDGCRVVAPGIDLTIAVRTFAVADVIVSLGLAADA